jgi:hypothetical protein
MNWMTFKTSITTPFLTIEAVLARLIPVAGDQKNSLKRSGNPSRAGASPAAGFLHR